MTTRALIAAAALALTLTATTHAQTTPRNIFNQPDLSGFWTNATLTPVSRDTRFGPRATYSPEEVTAIESGQQAALERGNQPTAPTVGAPALNGIVTPRGGTQIDGNYNRGWFDPGSSVMRVAGEPRNSILTTPNGQIPARKTATTAPANTAPRPAGASRFDNPEQLGLGDRCLVGFGRNGGPPMLSNGFYNNNYHLVQTRDAVVITVEMVHDARIVRLNAAHRTDGVRPWFGDSIGRYEGATLVVETTNIPQAQAYAGAWEQLKITERFTRTAKDRLRYQFTVEDPTVWDQPWGGEYEFAALNGRVMEYACHEGNYAMTGILYGARTEEAVAAKAGSQ